MRFGTPAISAVALITLACARHASADVVYTATLPNGTRVGPTPVSAGAASVPLGSVVLLSVAEGCTCSATLIKFQNASPNIALPVSILTGPDSGGELAVSGAGLVRLRMKVNNQGKIAEARRTRDAAKVALDALKATDKKPPASKDDIAAAERVLTDREGDLARAEGGSEEELIVRIEPKTWWTVADTVAYAVTRQSGNTAIAGAGIFVDPLTVLGGLLEPVARGIGAIGKGTYQEGRRLRPGSPQDIVQWSFVTHLLPPSEGEGPADIGIAPLGVGLFGNRVVFGVGWNVSRRGSRPDVQNRYLYIGFSASRLLSPRPPEQR